MQKQAIILHVKPRWRSALTLLFVAAVLFSFPHNSQAAAPSALTNGSFEQGFTVTPGCGSGYIDTESSVGTGWGCFTNKGAATFGFHTDTWAPVVADGQYSQLLEINTWDLLHGDNDRYIGIYQTAPVIAGADYRFSLAGMIRTTELEGDKWRYRVQVGYLQGADTNWKDVKNWKDVGWDKYYSRTEPGTLSTYQSIIKPQGDQITLFIRVWKKWGLTNGELDVNLDAIQLVKVDAPTP